MQIFPHNSKGNFLTNVNQGSRMGKIWSTYRMRFIITRDLYIYYPIFEDNFFVFKKGFFRKLCPYGWLVFKSSL
jgi:hypothetical protein